MSTRWVQGLIVIAIGAASCVDATKPAAERPSSRPYEPPIGEPRVGPLASLVRDGALSDHGADTEAAAVLDLAPSTSTSMGGPNDGWITGAASLPDVGPGFMHNPLSPNPSAHYGTVELVQAVVRAAAIVERELPGGLLKINDIGFERGGKITHHASHQNGRDVDILFYLLDDDGVPMPSVGAPLDTHGVGWDFKDLTRPEDDVKVRLDVARTWRFLQAIAEDDDALLQRVFIAEHLRSLLLDHAKRVNAPAAAIERIDDATCQPEVPHDDHMHLRFFCSSEDIKAGCQDTVPVYEWRRAQLETAGIAPIMAVQRARKPASKKPLPSKEENERFNSMHVRVLAFLKLRERWAERPHPGRKYCR